jgi:hypothetical protein
LAKPLKQSNKFKSQSLGLSIVEKVSSVKVVILPIEGVNIGGGNCPQPPQLREVRAVLQHVQ